MVGLLAEKNASSTRRFYCSNLAKSFKARKGNTGQMLDEEKPKLSCPRKMLRQPLISLTVRTVRKAFETVKVLSKSG